MVLLKGPQLFPINPAIDVRINIVPDLFNLFVHFFLRNFDFTRLSRHQKVEERAETDFAKRAFFVFIGQFKQSTDGLFQVFIVDRARDRHSDRDSGKLS